MIYMIYSIYPPKILYIKSTFKEEEASRSDQNHITT